ncbi:hypothetical protein VUR80DRAFT_4055 [Thermomyces stellatus]
MEFYIPDPDVSFADFPQLLSQGLDSTPLLRKPPRRLNFLKCRQCRRDKQKCTPPGRVWPGQRCDRNIDLSPIPHRTL